MIMLLLSSQKIGGQMENSFLKYEPWSHTENL